MSANALPPLPSRIVRLCARTPDEAALLTDFYWRVDARENAQAQIKIDDGQPLRVVFGCYALQRLYDAPWMVVLPFVALLLYIVPALVAHFLK